MGSQERERVQARVSPERKREWVEAVNDSSEYSNLSHLIIRSVEKELREEQEHTVQTENITADVDLSPVIEAINEVGEQVTNVQEKMNSIEAVAAESSQILDVTRDILKYVPNQSDIDIEPGEHAMSVQEPGVVRSEDVLLEDIREYGRVEDIVEYMTEHKGLDEETVRLAIEKLKVDMNRVEEHSGQLMRET